MIPLKQNELFVAVGKHRLPITCDTGADVSVVPQECVSPEQLVGKACEITSFNKTKSVGNLCNIEFYVSGKVFHRQAVTQPGELLGWTACLSLPFGNREELSFITNEMEKKSALAEEDTLYLPPEWKEGTLLSGVPVSEGTMLEPEIVVQQGVLHPVVVDNSEQLL